MHYFSKSTQGFYLSEINATMPEDVVALSEGLYYELLDGQSEGKKICCEDGLPFLQDRPKPTLEQLNAIVDISRRVAYAAESDPLFFQFQRGDVEKQDWLDSIKEIKDRYPKLVSLPE